MPWLLARYEPAVDVHRVDQQVAALLHRADLEVRDALADEGRDREQRP